MIIVLKPTQACDPDMLFWQDVEVEGVPRVGDQVELDHPAIIEWRVVHVSWNSGGNPEAYVGVVPSDFWHRWGLRLYQAWYWFGARSLYSEWKWQLRGPKRVYRM
jgi:hypothetical protein